MVKITIRDRNKTKKKVCVKFAYVYIFRFVSYALEIPTYLIVLLAEGKWGRRPLLGLLLFISGTCLMLLSITNKNRTILFLVGKCSIAGGNALMHVSIMMLYPTSIRNKALTLFAFVAWVASAFLELIVQYSVGNGGGQELNFILGTLGLLSSMTALYLPETINNPLPETINDIRSELIIKHIYKMSFSLLYLIN